MGKSQLFAFLQDLRDNNSKEWMDQNRHHYQTAKATWLAEIQAIFDRLEDRIPAFRGHQPKDTIMRINNNRRFNPSLPLYRDYFTFGISVVPKQGPYYHLSVSPGQCRIGGGVYRPDPASLKKVRGAIDYDGDQLRAIVEAAAFQDFYGGLAPDPHQLKSSPRGYAKDHPHLDLLRYKSLIGICELSDAEVLADDFIDTVERAYLSIQPLNDYFAQALLFEAEA